MLCDGVEQGQGEKGWKVDMVFTGKTLKKLLGKAGADAGMCHACADFVKDTFFGPASPVVAECSEDTEAGIGVVEGWSVCVLDKGVCEVWVVKGTDVGECAQRSFDEGVACIMCGHGLVEDAWIEEGGG